MEPRKVRRPFRCLPCLLDPIFFLGVEQDPSAWCPQGKGWAGLLHQTMLGVAAGRIESASDQGRLRAGEEMRDHGLRYYVAWWGSLGAFFSPLSLPC